MLPSPSYGRRKLGGKSFSTNRSIFSTTAAGPEHLEANLDPIQPPVDLSHISNTNYNRRCKELIHMSRYLGELGAQTYFDLPRICVIGGQSAGKSSLVEAVIGINVPRDSGTCTRCPLECTMAQAKEWSCTITLRLEFDDNDNPYPSIRIESFGPTLRDKSEVELWLRRAQAAILCPHLSSKEFHEKSKEDIENLRRRETNMREFSKNSIHVDVKDPEVTGLSFVDLPGLIQNSEMPELVDLVKDLVTSNIKQKNTLILIAIPMGDDIENQQAVRLAKDADPTGARTIGVLTKPDTVLSSSIGQLKKWQAVLEGKANILKHGYYCVRLPDEAERTMRNSHTGSEKLAEKFFTTCSPWNEMRNRERFGVRNLVRDASVLLVECIEKNLPILRKQVDDLLVICHEDLSNLPPPLLNDPVPEILLRVSNFSREFHDMIDASREDKGLARGVREHYANYKIEILKTSPDFRPFINHQEYSKPEIPTEEGYKAISSVAPQMDLQYVRRIVQRSIGWELSGHIPFSATRDLVQISTRLWRTPSLACFDNIYAMTERIIDKLVHKHFGQFPRAESYISALVYAELEQCKENARIAVEALLQIESQPLFTQNSHYLETEQKKWYKYFSDVCSQASNYKLEGMQADSPSKSEYNDELTIMAYVQAYFRVAYKRIIDYMPLTIEHSLNRALYSTLQKKLLAKLTTGPNCVKIEEMLMESPDVIIRRQVLNEQKARLMQMRTHLHDTRLEREMDDSLDAQVGKRSSASEETT
ncbi:hypothetical protein AX15_000462 [Amanita polypyramis BW_CC]|nr:hypothetical protein AX15_000462 [Amanita polypyramis BW_CC]